VSFAAGYQTDKVIVDHAFTEFINELLKVGPVECVGSKRSHCYTSMRKQPNGKTKPDYPALRGNVKDQLDRKYQGRGTREILHPH
jgi:hypothetical protein